MKVPKQIIDAYLWRDDGLWLTLNHYLLMELREAHDLLRDNLAPNPTPTCG